MTNVEEMSVLFKIAGALCVTAGCSGIGAGMAARMSERLSVLKRLRVMVIHLRGEILYAGAPLGESFERAGKRERGPEGELFRQVAERLSDRPGEGFFGIWQEETKRYLEKGPLTEREGNQLTAFGEHLGYLDRDMQERTIALYLEELEQEIEGINREISQKSRLYTSVGVMAGLFLAVVLL